MLGVNLLAATISRPQRMAEAISEDVGSQADSSHQPPRENDKDMFVDAGGQSASHRQLPIDFHCGCWGAKPLAATNRHLRMAEAISVDVGCEATSQKQPPPENGRSKI